MPCTIGFWHHSSGVTGLTMQLFGLSSGAILNGAGGDAFLEPDASSRPRYYEASVTQALGTGVCKAQVLKGGSVIYDGLVRISGSGPCVIDDGSQWSLAELRASALSQLTGLRRIEVTIPTLDEEHLSVPLVRGDSYLDAHGRALVFSRSDFPDLPPEATCRLTARSLLSPTDTFTLVGSIAVAAGTKVLKFEPVSDETRHWEPGKYEFDVEVEFPDGNVATFVGPNVFLRVIQDVTDSLP